MSTKYDSSGVRDFILEKVQVASTLNEQKVLIADEFLVVNLFPVHFDQLKITTIHRKTSGKSMSSCAFAFRRR